MKFKLLLISLLLGSQLCHADATLVYKLPAISKVNKNLSYYIKEGQLRYEEPGSNKINLFDQKTQQFSSLDQATGTISRINRDMVGQHVKIIQQQRQEKLKTVEAELRQKMTTMDENKREAAEVILNKLKYPEFYGDHTFLTSKETSTTKKISQIECRIYNIRQNEQLVRQLCMASRETLKISQPDYQTLRSFLKFNYDIQSQMSLAAGQSSFTYVDYEQHNIQGIPLEIVLFNEEGSRTDQVLESISHKSLSKAQFEIKSTLK